jgi:dephospho-CoA kinase
MIGLTGGIGAGKSTVAELLRRRGAVVIDADVIARQVVEPGTKALAALVAEFGDSIIDDDGALIRPRLAELAFVDDQRRKALESITHPAIATEFFRQLEAAEGTDVIVHDVPLLVESTRGYNYAGVIVVEAPLELRLSRLEQRGVDRGDAERRIALQASDEQRRAVATWVLDNSATPDALDRQIDAIWPEVRDRAMQDDTTASSPTS